MKGGEGEGGGEGKVEGAGEVPTMKAIIPRRYPPSRLALEDTENLKTP